MIVPDLGAVTRNRRESSSTCAICCWSIANDSRNRLISAAAIRHASAEVRQVGADAEIAELHGVVVKKICGHTFTNAPSARDVRAGSVDTCFGLAADGLNFFRHVIGFFFRQSRKFERGEQVADDRGIFTKAGQRNVADHSVLTDLHRVTRHAAVGAINLGAKRSLAGPLRRVNISGNKHGSLLGGAELNDRRDDQASAIGR